MVKWRRTIVGATFIIGVLAFVAACLFTVGGAGILGSPFTGEMRSDVALFLILLLGPVAVLPCVTWDHFKPTWGGIALCSLALIEVVPIVWYCQREWGFAIHSAALASLGLSLPMMIMGTLLVYSSNERRMAVGKVWQVEVLIATIIAAYFIWSVGADGYRALVALLRGQKL